MPSTVFTPLRNLTYFFLLSCLIASCAVKRDLYRDQEDRDTYFLTENQETKVKAKLARSIKAYTKQTDTAKLNYISIYGLGNVGAYQKEPDSQFLETIQNHLASYSKKEDLLLFLGDNVHSNNLDKNQNNKQLEQQLKLSKSFKGRSIFMTGDLDWNEGGVDGLETLEDAIEDFYKEDDHFLPKNGCPIETIAVNDDVELIIINSQWYIEDWSKIKGVNDKCQLKTRIQFEALLQSEIRKAAHKTVVIAMHHPLYNNGIYGGEIPSTAIYGSTPENVFIPIAGTFWAFLRSQGGISKQDRFNPLMNKLMTTVETAAMQAPRVIVYSGHERSLQYISHPNLKQVISGTGSTIKAARLGKDGLFSSTKSGFTEIRLYDDRSSTIHFYGLDKSKKLRLLYEKEAFEKPDVFDVNALPNSYPKTFTASVYPKESIAVSKKYEKFWGKHYRYVYGLDVEAPVALLDTLYGGLRVERAGGGNQTLSLRLVDKDDREYNMRAIAKDPISFLKSAGYNDLDADDYFANTVPATVIEDFYTSAHPYGAFAIPRLAGALDINHTHPKLYYVPKQKRLGNFNETHGDKLYMIVEKPDGDFSDSHMFDNSTEVESTPDLFEELREDEKNVLDERAYIRARIFDILIGDWDRHEDQWRWTQQTDSITENTTYTAVPRDRDQVFANFDGSFLETLQKIMSGTRQFGKYGPDLPFIEQFSESAINLDRALVQVSDFSVWEEEVAYVQKTLTPEIIARAFSEMPVESQDDVWKGIQEDMLSRKRVLNEIITRYYAHFLKFQSLKATDKDDHIIIENLANGNVRARAYRIKDGEDGALLYDRTFTEATENIWVYGLDDKDHFEVKGNHKSKINVILVGGLEEDTYTINGASNVTVYDQKSYKNTIKSKGKATFHLDDIYENHIYDSEHRPDAGMDFGLEVGYDPDLGASPKLHLGKKQLGFERHPFTTKLGVDAMYHSLTQAALFNIEWHKAHILHDWNLKINAGATTHNYTENFFGLGNESENNAQRFDANRVVMQKFKGGLETYYIGEYGTSTAVGISYENTQLDQESTLRPTLLGSTEYISAHANYAYKSLDNDLFTTRGMAFNVKGAYSDELTNTTSFSAINSSLTFWNAVDRSRDLAFKTTFTGQFRFGDDIPFYNLASLGANTGLRSYRLQRFYGKQAATASVDFRYKFKALRTAFFPLRIQGYIGADAGRVWSAGESSKVIHNSYGGGLQLKTAGALHLNLSYFTGPEGGRLGVLFKLGV